MAIGVWLASGQSKVGDFAVTIIQQEFSHDIARLTVRNTPEMRGAFARPEPYPIKIIWGSPPNPGSFWGYIAYVDPDGLTDLDVVCVGATYPLGDSGYTVFKNTTVPFIVQRLADSVKLRADVAPNDQILTLSQHGKSGWQFLCEAAKRIGFTLYPNGSTLVAHERSLAVAEQRGTVRRLVNREQIVSWNSSNGPSSPTGGERAEREAFAIDPRRVADVFSKNTNQSKPALGPRVHANVFTRPHAVAGGSVSEIKGKVDAAIANNQLYIEATAEVLGNSRIRTASIAGISGVSSLDDGLWYVKLARHVITAGQDYRTVLVLGRDAFGGQAPAASPLAINDTLPTEPRLVGGSWVAA